MTTEQLPNSEAHPMEYADARVYLHGLFTDKDEQKINEFYSNIRAFAPAAGMEPHDTIEKLREIWESASPEEFSERSFKVLKKLLDVKIEHPELLEEIQRERIFRGRGNVRLSELMYYDVDFETGVIFVHVAPKGDMGVGGLLKSFRDGMHELARQVSKDSRIKEIQATSWIVASNPGLLQKAGFTVEGPIDEKMRTEHFTDETRPISWAHMSREELLKRYLIAE